LKPIRFRQEAAEEFAIATAWYGERSPEAKQHFLEDFQKASRLVRVYPSAWPAVYGNLRKCEFSRFPYQLIYGERDKRILVFAVMHCHQRPYYWKARL
jgi:hypothetical protein